MNNSETPTGVTGKKGVNVKTVSDEEMREHWNNFFEGEELEFNSFYFEEPKEQKQMMSATKVLTTAKYELVMNDIIEGVKKSIRRDSLEIIKRARTQAIMKKAKEKEISQNSGRETEKPDEYKDR